MAMTEMTGLLQVVTPAGTETFEWNGNPLERAAAKTEFEARMATGTYLASVRTSARSWSQVRSFSEVELVEKEQGKVEAKISPALVGG
jgi:hypothetical protein